MNKTQQILVLLLLLQGIAAAVVFWPEPAVEVSDAPLLADWDAAAVTALTIVDDQGNELRVEKDAGGWRVASAGDFPATAGTAEALLGKFGAINGNRLVTQTAASHSRLQVAADDFLRRITVEFGADQAQTFFLGSAQNARAVHVRLENDDNVYLTSAVNIWEAAATIGSWMDTRYIQLDQGALREATLTNAAGTFTFIPSADGGWQLADLAETETANTQNINNLLFRLPGLRFARPLGTSDDPVYGLAAPTAVINLTTAAGEETLRIGTQNEEGDYYAAYSGSPYYVLLANSSAADFVNWTRADFTAAPAEDEE